MRLRRARDFERVFKRGYRTVDDAFAVLALDNDTGIPRLGLAIARKHVKLASDRNRVKRLIRESFRHRAEDLPAIDIVVMARRGLPACTRGEMRDRLEARWQGLLRHFGPREANGA